MGCFNSTCVVSNLPIMNGDKIANIFLFKSKETTMTFNTPVKYHNYIPLFFYGEYNDYGASDENHGISIPHILSITKEITKHEAEYLEDFYEYRDSVLQPAMIRMDVLKGILEKHVINGYDVLGEEIVYTTTTFEDSKSRIKEFVKFLYDCINYNNTQIDPNVYLINKFTLRSVDSIARDEEFIEKFCKNKKILFLKFVLSNGIYNTVGRVDSILLNLIEKNELEKAEALVKEMLIFNWVMNFMVSVNKVLVPRNYGSQDSELESHKILNQITANVIQAIEQENE